MILAGAGNLRLEPDNAPGEHYFPGECRTVSEQVPPGYGGIVVDSQQHCHGALPQLGEMQRLLYELLGQARTEWWIGDDCVDGGGTFRQEITSLGNVCRLDLKANDLESGDHLAATSRGFPHPADTGRQVRTQRERYP